MVFFLITEPFCLQVLLFNVRKRERKEERGFSIFLDREIKDVYDRREGTVLSDDVKLISFQNFTKSRIVKVPL